MADGTLVSFGTTRGSVSPTPVPTIGGIAQTTLSSGPEAGIALVTGRCGNAIASVSVTFVPAAPASVVVAANPPTVPVGGQATVVATVRDQWGNLVSDGSVLQFNATLGSVWPVSGMTMNGQATTTFQAGTLAGDAWITATAGGGSGQTVIPVLPSVPATLDLVAFPASIPLTGTATIQASVMDAYANPMADGTQVSFNTTLGAVNPQSATTMDGVAASTLLAGGEPGVATLTAQAGLASDSTQVKIGVGAPISISLSADPAQIPADGVSTSTITALVLDPFEEPITQTIPITFETTSGQVMPPVTWVVNGTAVTHLSGTQAGAALITARAANASGGTTVLLVSGLPALLTMSVTPAQMPVGGLAAVVVQVADAFGNAVADGTLVTFAPTIGSTAPSVVGTTNGTAQMTLNAGWVAGDGLVTAVCGVAAGEAAVTVLPGGAAAMTLTADPSEVQANGQDQSKITATVVDMHGNRVAGGTLVSFATTRGSVNPTVAETSGGEAHTVLTASTVAGVASVTGASAGASATVDVTMTAGAPAVILLQASQSSIPADGQSQAALLSTVTDAFGNAVADGTWVAFGTSLGSVSPVMVATQGGTPQSTLTSGTQAGTAEVTATAGTVSGSISIILQPGAAAGVGVEASPGTLVADGESTATVEATVMDQFDNAVQDGTEVLFAVTLGSITPITATTQGGLAMTTFQAGTQEGTAAVTAWSGVAVGQAQIVLVAGPPGRVVLTDEPQAVVADGVSQSTILVRVSDNSGHPVVDGTQVHFSTTMGSVTPSVGYTAGGWATVTLTAGVNVGVAVVTATSGSVEATVGVQLIAGPPAYLGLQSDDYSLPVGVRFTTTVRAVVEDAIGHPVADGTPVTFTVGLGSISPGRTTTLNGWATAVYTGARAGRFAQIAAETEGAVSHPIWIWLEQQRVYLPVLHRRWTSR